jgi:hypothetical protein
MFPPKEVPLFGITHPLGLPRPVDCENLFGAKIGFFCRNVMPVPTGCLEHFDGAVYRPYVRRLAAFLAQREPGWSGPEILDDPPRYCLLRFGAPSEVPDDLESLLPQPPRVTLAAMLSDMDRRRKRLQPLQLLDVLTLIREDAGVERFSAAVAAYPWVAEFMR